MELRIISSVQTILYRVNWIDIVTTDGSLVILPEHAPMVATLMPKKEFVFECKDGSIEHVLVEKNGIIEVTRTDATVLL